jgi:thiamine-monophosphate kinase
MGAIPFSYTLSLCLTSKINNNWLKKFTSRLSFLQRKYNFFLIGGDISKSSKIIISSNFFGFTKQDKILNRIGAKANDDIWVTGNLGESSIGLAIKQKKIRLDYISKKYFLRKFHFPEPSILGNKINSIATSAIDISDGFYGDLEKLINKKNLGAIIHSNKIPFSNKLKKLIKDNKINFHYPMSSGDDYELLFTAHPKKTSIINNISKIYKIKISKVGKIIGKNGLFIDGSKITNIKKSYQHFF